MRIQRVRDLEQCVCPTRLLLLSHIKARVLVTDRHLACDRFEKSDFFIEPFARLVSVMEPQEPQNFFIQNDRNNQQRPGFESLRKEFQRSIFCLRNVIDADRFGHVETLGEFLGVKWYRRPLALGNRFVLSPFMAYQQILAIAQL